MRSIEERLGGWYEILNYELNKDYFRKLGSYIAERRKKIEVYPISDKVFRAFELTDPDKVVFVMIGTDPYNNKSTWNQEPVADGLAFSTNKDDRTPLPLFKIQHAIEQDCYDGFRLNKDNDLEFLAKRQNVLLLNSFLTSEKNKTNSHQGIGWEEFNKVVLQYLLDKSYPISFITFGDIAKKLLDECTIPEQHLVINLEHPSNAATEHRELDHQNAFTKVNDFIEKHYGKLSRIKWML